MAAFPVGKYDHSGALLANYARHLQAVLPGILHPAIRNIQSLAPGNLQDASRLDRLRRTLLGAAAGAHFALGQIEDPGGPSALRHLEQGAAAGLLHVITVGGNGQNVEGGAAHGKRQSRLPCSMTTFSRTIKRCAAISRSLGKTRFTCSSASMKVITTGSLPPASTRCVVCSRCRPVKPATACSAVAPATFSWRR